MFPPPAGRHVNRFSDTPNFLSWMKNLAVLFRVKGEGSSELLSDEDKADAEADAEAYQCTSKVYESAH